MSTTPEGRHETTLGVDFGTSHTVAVLARGGTAAPLLFDASPLLSSAVFAAADRTLLTGMDAERAGATDPAQFEPNPKRRIDDGLVLLGEREVAVADLITAVFARVRAECQRVIGGPPARLVLTHPAAWGRTRLAVLADAAVRVGLGQPAFLPEPVAAAAYFGSGLGRQLPAGRCLIVYDLGAGTFDVSVVRRSAAGFEVLASDGLNNVGGLDLDAAIVDHMRSLTAGATAGWGRLDWPQTPADQRFRHALWRDARGAKEQLSRLASARLHVPLVEADHHVTREEFEKLARPLLEQTVSLTLRAVRAEQIAPEHISGVFLVGGASRVPLAGHLLFQSLRMAPTVTEQPELVVADGAVHATTPPAGSASATATGPSPTSPPTTPPPMRAAPVAWASTGPPPLHARPVAGPTPAPPPAAFAARPAGAGGGTAVPPLDVRGRKTALWVHEAILAAIAVLPWVSLYPNPRYHGLGIWFVGWSALWTGVMVARLRFVLRRYRLRIGPGGIETDFGGHYYRYRWRDVVRVDVRPGAGTSTVGIYVYPLTAAPAPPGRSRRDLPRPEKRTGWILVGRLRDLRGTTREQVETVISHYAGPAWDRS